MSARKYLGTTAIFSPADNFTRTYHLWGYVELGGELTGFHYSSSRNFKFATTKFCRADCNTQHLLRIWTACETIAAQAQEDDETVIEAIPTQTVVLFPRTEEVPCDESPFA